MPSAEQIANRMQRELVEQIEGQLAEIDKHLRKYDALIAQRTKLQSARRALLSERATTNGGGRGLTQEEVVNYMTSHGSYAPFTVSQLASGLSVTEAVVRGHLNRGKDERFEMILEEGVKKWDLREPENDEEEDDE
jgi:hypothetical protein